METTMPYDPTNILMDPTTGSTGRSNVMEMSVRFMDANGRPIENVTFQGRTSSGVSNQDGYANIEYSSPTERIAIRHVSYENFTTTIDKLDPTTVMFLEEQQLDEVVITNKKDDDGKKISPWLIAGGVFFVFAIAGVFSGGETGSTGLNAPAKTKKGKKGKKKTNKKGNRKKSVSKSRRKKNVIEI